jgi:hypothetical protein
MYVARSSRAFRMLRISGRGLRLRPLGPGSPPRWRAAAGGVTALSDRNEFHDSLLITHYSPFTSSHA